MIEQKRKELENALVAKNKLEKMLNSDGWKDVVEPMIKRLQETLEAEFLSATKYEDFVRIQQGLNMVNVILSNFKLIIARGKDALKTLQKETFREPQSATAEHPKNGTRPKKE